MKPDMAEAVAAVSFMVRRGKTLPSIDWVHRTYGLHRRASERALAEGERRGNAAALELIHHIPARGERPADWKR